jgi:hypothetical protein
MVGELKTSHIMFFILFCVLPLRLSFYELIPKSHMYFHMRIQVGILPGYRL